MWIDSLKEKLNRNESVYGTFINSGSTIACEIAGLAGYDYVMIDSEHGPTDAVDNRELILAAEYRGCVPLVRVSNASSDLILRTLDVGAHGVMVPQVNDAERAKAVASAVHYFPQGTRGVANARAADYGFVTPLPHYFELANQRNLAIVQCENIQCLPHLEEICAVEGVDVIFIGPYDLSTTMGAPGKVGYDSIREIADRVIEVTKQYGKVAGIFVKNAEEAKFYEEKGFRFLLIGTDIGSYAAVCRTTIAQLKQQS